MREGNNSHPLDSSLWVSFLNSTFKTNESTGIQNSKLISSCWTISRSRCGKSVPRCWQWRRPKSLTSSLACENRVPYTSWRMLGRFNTSQLLEELTLFRRKRACPAADRSRHTHSGDGMVWGRLSSLSRIHFEKSSSCTTCALKDDLICERTQARLYCWWVDLNSGKGTFCSKQQSWSMPTDWGWRQFKQQYPKNSSGESSTSFLIASRHLVSLAMATCLSFTLSKKLPMTMILGQLAVVAISAIGDSQRWSWYRMASSSSVTLTTSKKVNEIPGLPRSVSMNISWGPWYSCWPAKSKKSTSPYLLLQ